MRSLENPGTSEAEAPKPVAPLDVAYERPVPWTARKGAFYLIILLLMLNVVATTSITWGPIVMRGVQERLAARRAAAQAAQIAAQEAAAQQKLATQRQSTYELCLPTMIPKGQVIYTEDPAEAARLIEGTTAYSCIPVSTTGNDTHVPHLPAQWNGPLELRNKTNAISKLGDLSGTIFLHERRAVGGQPRLVWLRIVAGQEYEVRNVNNDRFQAVVKPHRVLEAYVHEPPGADGNGGFLWDYNLHIIQPERNRASVEYPAPYADAGQKEKGVSMKSGDMLRILAGQPDPADASHLTIDYTLEGKPGVIDVWLRPDDRLRVETHSGRKRTEIFGGATGVEYWNPHESE